MVVRVLSSRRGDAPLPILSSVIFIEACVEPMGVVTVMPMSPGAAFGATRIGISTSVGFPANGLVSMPGLSNLIVAPTRFFPRSLSIVEVPADTESGETSVTCGCICSRVPRVTESVMSMPGLFSNMDTTPSSSML